jgi:hypothetical protein
VKLVLCLVAVIPVLGGVMKGVGKLAIRAAEKSEDLAKLGAEMIMFLNRMGRGNAYQWLRQLDFLRYQSKITGALTELLDRLTRASQYIVRRMAGVLPQGVVQYLAALPSKLQRFGQLANRMVPQALKDLNECLVRVRAHLVEGTFADVTVGAGKVTTRESEGRLATAAQDAGKIPHPKASLENYHHMEGWPNLATGFHIAENGETRGITYQTIESFSRDAPIVAETLGAGNLKLSRVLDTQQLARGSRTKTGLYWLESMPANGHDWREHWAVLHAWSSNGMYVQLNRIPTADELRAMGIALPDGWDGLRVWRGQVSSQFDEKLGRYLQGGHDQIAVDFTHPHNAVLKEYVANLTAFPTNWKDVNFAPTERTAVQAMNEGERATKSVPQGYTNRVAAGMRKTTPKHSEQPQ